MKLKEKIRNKLRLWLLADDLLQVEESKKAYEDAHERSMRANMQLVEAVSAHKESYKLVNDCHKMMNQMIDVGTDVGFYSDDHSWAVVCIKGHPEFVKFIPLLHNDARAVLEFLKHFKYADIVVDSPFAFRDMVDNRIMENPFKSKEKGEQKDG